ncbi:hypothetical protein P7L70_26520 [Tistrella mobilis]|uniref:hypothetical protein n=1 Tax=Tistrella mobilis TaxID=171437 RepID=UPI0035579A3D
MSALDAIRRIETARPVPGWGGATTRSAPLGESWQDEIRRVDPSGTGGEDGGSAFEQALARDQQNQEQQRGSGFGQRFSAGTLSTLIALQADPGFTARSYSSADVTSPSRAAARYEATANSTVLDDTAGAGDGGTATARGAGSLFGLFQNFVTNRPEASSVIAAYRAVQSVRADDLGRQLAVTRFG